MSNKFPLSKDELKRFHEQGYIGPFTLYEPEEMERKLKELRPKLIDTRNAVYNEGKGISGVTNLANYDRHLDISLLAEHVMRREIVDRVASIFGPDLLCWRTEFFPKYPGDEGTDWHQANTFANVSKSKMPQIEWPKDSSFKGTLTVWTAFTEATIENGCMQVIPATHRTMYYDETKPMIYDENKINSVDKDGQKRGFFGYDYRQLQIEPDWKVDESKAVSMIMRPGQFFIFLSTLLHGSHPHSGKTKNPRLGYAARYVPTEVKVYPYSEDLDEFGGNATLKNYGAVLVSGEDKYKHNKLVVNKD